MKSILISIKPKYVAEILNHRKTIEIRKTAPKCDLPIDVYIYCTKGAGLQQYVDEYFTDEGSLSLKNEKVVAKFRLEKIDEVHVDEHMLKDRAWDYVLSNSCLNREELRAYAGGSHPYYGVVFAWHISDLRIFDKPKPLSEFGLKHAVQSWCYVEEKMKYIRTIENKIINIEDTIQRFKNKQDLSVIERDIVKCVITESTDDYGYKRRVIKEANTIEKLCDEFILHDRGRSCIIGDIEAREIAADKTVSVYGAIWVEDGGGNPILKSVAKMNEKGELELL